MQWEKRKKKNKSVTAGRPGISKKTSHHQKGIGGKEEQGYKRKKEGQITIQKDHEKEEIRKML